MKFATRFILAAAIVAVGTHARLTNGGFGGGGGGGGTGDSTSGWTIVAPIDGSAYDSHPGYLGAGPLSGTGALCVYQRFDVKPGAIYPSELTMLYSETVDTVGSTSWGCQSHGESGKLFACVFPSTGHTGSLAEDVLILTFGEELNVEDLVAYLGGDSSAFRIGPDTGN